MTSSPLFIVGAARSGTTLLREVCRLMDGVFLPTEELQLVPLLDRLEGRPASHIADRLDRSPLARHLRAQGSWPSQRELRELVTPVPAETLRRLARRLGEGNGRSAPRWWGDKTPSNVHQLGLLRAWYPDLRVVEIRRDPRAVALSMRKAWGRSLARGALAWRSALASGEADRQRHPDSHHVVHYEALVREPEQVLEELTAWLGTTADVEALDAVQSRERWGSARHHTGVTSQPRTAWRHELSPSEVRCVEQVVFDLLPLVSATPEEADRFRLPSPLAVAPLRLRDGFLSLRSYAAERGWREAIAHKSRQFADRPLRRASR